MVRELERVDRGEFPETAPTANPVFYRTYSRKTENGRETWVEVCDRTINGLRKLGQLTPEETDLLYRMQSQLKTMSSGRWLWVGGTEWITQPENFSGAYNCSSTNIIDWRAFGLLMDLAMMGCGTGAVLEGDYINQLPPIRNHLNLILRGEIGSTPAELRREFTELKFDGDQVEIYVGDSRQGWVGSYQALLELSTDERFSGEVKVIIDLSDVRPAGEQLKGFGGVANPVKLPELYQRCGNILNQAVGRQLNSVECCVLIDEAAVTIVAGNIRRCLPEGALVHTASGLVPIEKIRIGDRVLTSKGFYPVTNFFDQGTQSLCRIQTEDGYFECTADHKVAVLQDLYGNYKMIKAQDLQESDRLIFVPQAIPGTPTELPELKGVTSDGAKPITVPALTSEVAYFLGYLHGDGSVASDGTQVRFRVHQDSPEILERLINVAQEFGLETHTLRTPEQCKTKAYELQLNSSILNKYLSQFKQSFTSIVIPDCILMGTIEIRQAYLAGLADADGCHSQGVLVASVYQDFLQQVQALYASLGITTRLCGSVRKRTGKWEGELVTVGESAFEAVEKVMMTYSTQFPVKKRKRPKFFHDHGFPKEMAQPLVNTFDWNNRKQMMVRIVKNFIADATDLIPVKVKKVEMDVREASTYDIEVASIHEFVCQGILVANSAGMRQGNSSDRLFTVAKDNLWRQDENGNWGIDPERDALRMANHTHVFHHKPTLEECVEAVRKQFYSGEGAIQWAGEAVARANRDLLSTPEIKRDFINAYGQDNAKKWFQEHYPNISNDELEHRLARLGLNPCHSGDTLVSTDQGLIPIQDLVGKQFKALVDLRSVGLSGVKLTEAIAFATGVKTTYKIILTNGMQMRCTADHQHFTSRGWVSTKDLSDNDNVYVQRGAGYFGKGTISVAQAQMLGWWYGDGFNEVRSQKSEVRSCFCGDLSNSPKTFRLNRKQDHFAKGFVFNQDEYETAYNIVGKAVASITGREYVTTLHKGVYEFRTQSPKLEKFFADLGIVGKDELPNNFMSQSQEVLIGFLQGIFSADGTVDKDSRRIKLAMRSEKLLQQIQLILSNLGIISTVRAVREKGYRGVPYTTVDGTEKISLDRGSYGLFISTFNFNLFQQLIGFSLSPSKDIKAEKWLNKPLPNYFESTINSKFTSKVKKVEEFGEEVVYDLHVPLTNSFIANGCLTHNCGEIIGSNFHCVSGDTLLITRDNIHKIKDIVGQKVEIWNGKNWSQVIPIKTGKDRKLYRVKFGDGSYLDVTEYHRFFVKDRFGKNYQEVQTKDLLTHSKYTLQTEPFVIDYQDGNYIDSSYAYTLGKSVISYQLSVISKSYVKKRNLRAGVLVTDLGFSEELIHRLQTEPDALNTIASWNKPAILAFIAGLADTNGSDTKGHGIKIYLSDYEQAKRLQLLLTKCGISASVNLIANRGSTTNLGERNKDLYYLQITDCSEIPCKLMTRQNAQSTDFKQNNQTIQSVEELPGLHDTYCFEEPEFHKGVFGNTLTGNCNLSEIHLNQIDPNNHKEQEEAFTAGALSVATLLNHKFVEPRYRYSRELDPIVGVSFTGLFDFFVKAFGIEWLHWWQAGRPATIQGLEFKQQEAEYLTRWREIVHQVVWEYCDRHNLKRPNRCTTVQPSGTKSLLTNAAPGWHPPFGLRWVRRITFAKNDPVALACLDYGYSVIPGQSSKDENGNLLNDPFDDRAKEWLVEIPVQVSWIDLPGVEEIAIENFSATAMFDFYMGVQQHWTTHNSSSTILLTEAEIEPLGKRIYEAIRDDEGYISSALLARFDAPFPRLPFERISQEEYEKMQEDVLRRRKSDNFSELMNAYVLASELPEMGPQDPACSGMVCELKGSSDRL
ncbi:MAG: ribonucleoside-triphosphate reductase, adenosylcobalamin-dependent [Cyanobacteriota bacterium]|nr:ribonucleoside-triphosphate reductase, adenosylcobalamin-dependent [Cyanobacteriota bacterium]